MSNIIPLVHRYFDGEISSEEADRLRRWVIESEANATLFSEVALQHFELSTHFSHQSIAQAIDCGMTDDQLSSTLNLLRAQADAKPLCLVDLTDDLELRKQSAKRPQYAGPHRRGGLPDPRRDRLIVIPRSVFWTAVAALLLLCALITIPLLRGGGQDQGQDPGLATQPPDPPPQADVQLDAPPIARVTHALNAAGPDEDPFDAGDELEAGLYELQRGLISIEFVSGARVVIEGPSRFELTGTNQIRLKAGRLRALAEGDAEGFTVDVLGARVVDFGTEFGVSVEIDGEIQTHVFSGEVALEVSDDKGSALSKLLKAGDARSIDHSGTVSVIEVEPLAYVGVEELVASIESEDSARARWVSLDYQIRRDDDLLIYYTFEHARHPNQIIPNRASFAGANRYDALARTSGLARGRFQGTTAVMLAQNSDTIDAELDRELDEISIAGWFWIDDLDTRFASLLHSDFYDGDEMTGVHWHINRNHRDGWAIEWLYHRPRDIQNWHDALSPLYREEDLTGRWLHLAVTCDTKTGMSRLYIDGTQVASREAVDPVPVNLGTFSIGAWNIAPDKRDTRNWPRTLRGRVDEFVVFSRALSDEEIDKLYDWGHP